MLQEQIIRENREEEARKKFNEYWINLLTEGNTKSIKEFREIEFDSISTPLAIMEYRRLQMQEGRGQNITLEQLQKANINDTKVLQEMLQEMFLEPIPIGHLEFFYKNAVERGYKNITDAITELYRRHFEDKGTRFLSIVLTI